MMKSKLGILLALVVSMPALAQEKAEDFPFEDFPDLDAPTAAEQVPSSTPSPKAATSSKSSTTKKSEPKVEAAPLPEEGPVADVAPDKSQKTMSDDEMFLDEKSSKTANESPAPQDVLATEEAPVDAKAAAALDGYDAEVQTTERPTVEEDFASAPEDLMESGATEASNEDVPDDILSLEKRLEEAETEYAAKQGDRSNDGEPGEGLAPSEQYARVPLRPQMSDANWNRWAGKALAKKYKVRAGDSLWGVSERLFGTPYLWPKVWHLNANITNPHIITRGMELSFVPGNPFSAPELAYTEGPVSDRDIGLFPMTKFDKKRSLLELIDESLRTQLATEHPLFQYFLMDTEPEILGRIPKIDDREGRVYFSEGEELDVSLPDGEFPVARITPVRGKFHTSYRVRWIGNIRIVKDRALITKAFAEIQSGDLVINRKFNLKALAVHEDTLGPELRGETELVGLQEGAEVIAAEYALVGIRFPNVEVGPRPGAVLTIRQGQNRTAKALLVDRDRRVGTLWLLGTEKEVSRVDDIF